jgi:hypothetical protein
MTQSEKRAWSVLGQAAGWLARHYWKRYPKLRVWAISCVVTVVTSLGSATVVAVKAAVPSKPQAVKKTKTMNGIEIGDPGP